MSGALAAALLMLVSAQDEVDCQNARTQSEMTGCAIRDFERADAELNEQWRVTLAERRKGDQISPPNRDGLRPERGYAEVLLDSQRAWLAFRDADCVVDGQAMRGGTGEPMLVAGCRANLTRERTKRLREIAEGY